jgi:hypothetical protein
MTNKQATDYLNNNANPDAYASFKPSSPSTVVVRYKSHQYQGPKPPR